MERVFKSLGNNKVVDLVPYLKSKLSESKDISIYVGCDSQNVMNETIYACVIVLHYGRSGAHVIYTKEKVNRIKDRFVKLWKEVTISLEVAQFLETHGMHATYVDLDLNPDPQYKSNSILRSAVGLIESYGFETRVKPDSCAASYCADRLCKK
jgi:predicted RNase H-related nuclease YkuK (DUF458 family)